MTGAIDFKYEIIIYWSEEDQEFIAEVPELPGCCAHGETYEKTAANAKASMAVWIEVAKEIGREIPVAKGRLIFA